MSDLLSPAVVARLVGVIDLHAGRAVHAVRGDRRAYRPVACCHGDAPALARLYAARGVTSLYVADLDALAGGSLQTAVIAQLCDAAPFDRVLLDGGWRAAGCATRDTTITGLAREFENLGWIAATETARSLPALAELSALVSAQKCWLGLDFFGPRLLGVADPAVSLKRWVEHAVRLGFAGAVILDLASVGARAGPTTIQRCQRVRRWVPHWQLAAGGGVRSAADVAALVGAGCDRCLVATALHDDL